MLNTSSTRDGTGGIYKMHERALHGTSKVALSSLARALVRRSEPHLKLH